jgi:putative spermidine/putrescine transport system ATP-binding protein
MARLVLDHISKRFGSVLAVDDVSLKVGDGELVCLLGPSGCGKSTLLRLIAGFEQPEQGSISVDGQDITALPPNRRPTGMVFQSHALWPHMDVFGNIAFGLKLRRVSKPTIVRTVFDALDLVGLSSLGSRKPFELSGGQQQRVAIARCLVLEPKILLMDEPFSALDAHLRGRLRDDIHAIQRRIGLTTIFVTHDQEEALTLADRIAVMNAGKDEQVGGPAEIYDHPRTPFVAGFLGTMNLMDGHLDGGKFRMGSVELDVPGPPGPSTLAVRAEDMVAVPQQERGSFSGAVKRLVDLGAFRMVQVDIGAPAPLRVRLPKGRDLKEGDSLNLKPTMATLFQSGRDPLEIRFETRQAEGAPIG